MHLPSKLLSLTAVGAALTACGGDGVTIPDNAASAVQNYAAIVSASYQDSLASAQAMDTALTAFTGAPSTNTLSAARQAWLDSREPYLQTEVYRFYDGPIDNPTDGPEGLLNAWPLDEAYIDYVMGDPSAGIINDTAETIDATNLESLNEQGGEENIATGFHAIEFLLWGQDFSVSGPGDRPHTDFLTAGGTAANQDRRQTYLSTVSTMLVGHLQDMVTAWAAGNATNYRAEIEGAAPEEGLRRILTGMIVLTGFETGGERLQTALDSGDQEDEHSCFSDNTHRDMIQDIQGVKNVWDGSYTRTDSTIVSGVGIGDVVREVDETLATRIDSEIATALAAANALQIPFDQEIAPSNTAGNARVQTLIDALRTLEGSLQDVFRLFELTIPSPE